MSTAEEAIERLSDPAAEVSSHYVIDENGRVSQLVDEENRAWHAGRSYWRGERDLNSWSIGIELANAGPLDGFPPFAAALMDALEDLLADIMGRRSIPPEAVLGHSDIAIRRKSDPGAKLDWTRLERGALARKRPNAEPVAVDHDAFAAALTDIGYDPDIPLEHRLAAFRLRWFPGRRGVLGPHEMGLALALAAIDQDRSSA